MEVFERSSVKIRDPQRVKNILLELINGGKERLQVVADFDFTLSRFHKDGNRCGSCHAALSSSTLMPKEYSEQSEALFLQYYPVEININMSLEEKAPFMKEWWDKSHQVLEKFPVKKSDVKAVVKSSNVVLRDGCREMMETLQKNSIPLLILSAGLGDLLEEVVRQQAGDFDNITTISNFMEFDENGTSCGFKGDTIHICNKNISSKKIDGCSDQLNGKQNESLGDRQNAILMGDSLGDLNMAEGLHDIKTILKIGFLNQKIEESLNQYMEGYDVVLIDDQSLDLVNSLLTKIFSQDHGQ